MHAYSKAKLEEPPCSCVIILKGILAFLVMALSLVTQRSPSLEGSIGPHRKTWVGVTRDM